MDSKQWNSLKQQPDKAKKMLSALHMSSAYLKVSWNELDEGDQKKVSNWVSKNASGWFEVGEPTNTPKGIKNVAPKHRKAAVKKESEWVLRTPMKKSSVRKVIKEEPTKAPIKPHPLKLQPLEVARKTETVRAGAAETPTGTSRAQTRTITANNPINFGTAGSTGKTGCDQ